MQQVIFNGADGNDILDARESSTTLEAFGGEGDDLLLGGSAEDTFFAGGGDDIVVGQRGNDTASLEEGDDRFIWNNGDGSDFIDGGAGFDVTQVNGADGAGDEFDLRQVDGQAIFNRLNLGLFTLTNEEIEQFEINGQGGDDSLTVDDLTGSGVQSVVFSGGDGNDFLDASGTTTPIVADGGAGDDILLGGAGDDILLGGNGNNVYTGGAGADIFVVSFDGIDVINDFNRAEGDILQISRSEFGISSIEELNYDNTTGVLSLQDTQIATISNDASSPINSDSSASLVVDSGPVFIPGEDLQLV